MATTTDYKTASTVTSEDRSGAPAWSNPGNAATSNDSRAEVGMSAGAYSDWLRFTGFDFSEIPEDASVVGIQVRREGGATATNSVRDDSVYLRNGGGQVGDNGATATMWPSYSDGVEVHGAVDDTWNSGLTSACLASIGLDVSVINTHGTQARTAMVDCFDIAVTWEAAAEPSVGGYMTPMTRYWGP